MRKVKMTISFDQDAALLLETLTSERKRGEYLSGLVRQQTGTPTKEALIAMLHAYEEHLVVA